MPCVLLCLATLTGASLLELASSYGLGGGDVSLLQQSLEVQEFADAEDRLTLGAKHYGSNAHGTIGLAFADQVSRGAHETTNIVQLLDFVKRMLYEERVPLMATVVVVFMVFATIGILRDGIRPESDACVLHLLVYFVMLLGAGLLILDSHSLAGLGHWAPGVSGQIISLWGVGQAAGSVIWWLAVRVYPRLCFDCPRAISIGSLIVNSFAAVLTIYGIAKVQDGFGHRGRLVLSVARVMGGSSFGFFQMFLVATITGSFVGADFARFLSVFNAVAMMSVGSGPLISGLLNFRTEQTSSARDLQTAPIVYCVALLLSMVGVLALRVPPSSRAQLEDADEMRRGAYEGRSHLCPTTRVIAIFTCIAVCFLRAFIVSGSEVGAALILEARHKLHPSMVGLFVGVSFLLAGPAQQFHERFVQEKLTIHAQFCLWGCVACCGSALYFPMADALLPNGRAIVLADCLLFPSASILDALSWSVAIQLAPHDESTSSRMKQAPALQSDRAAAASGPSKEASPAMPSKSNVTLVNLFFSGIVFRFGGPWCCRWLLEASADLGQTYFASLQLCLCVFSIMLFHVGAASSANEQI